MAFNDRYLQALQEHHKYHLLSKSSIYLNGWGSNDVHPREIYMVHEPLLTSKYLQACSVWLRGVLLHSGACDSVFCSSKLGLVSCCKR